MNKIFLLSSLTIFTFFSSFTMPDVRNEILLWPGGAPGSEGKTSPEKVRIAESGDHVISNIHYPSITSYIPDKNKATGVAVIIAPGGGHRELWIDHEGYNVADYLKEKGIAAFVLKYRLAREENSSYKVEEHSLGDIERAIRLVKSRAREWAIDPEKVGVMGFSAGGELAALSAMRFDEGTAGATDMIEQISSRPAFQGLIYPGGTAKLEVVKNAPPLFLLGGYEDRPDIAEGIAEVYLKYKRAGVPAELHIYSKAGHGFGLRNNNKGPVSMWPQRFVEWINNTVFK